MSFASNNPFNPPPYQSSTDKALVYEHDLKQSKDGVLPISEVENDEKWSSQSPSPPTTPRRGSNESSTGASVYSDNLTLVDAPTSAVKTLDILHTSSHINLRIHDPANNGICKYYVDHSTFTPKKADVILFAGGDKQGCPIAGVATWSSMYSKEINIGLGDAGIKNENASSIPWEQMTATSGWKQKEHHWALSSDKHPYIWKRDSWYGYNFKLLDGNTKQVVAAFESNRFKAWKKFGRFTYRDDLGDEWQLMALLTLLGMIEKSRRRSRARRSSAGGGN